MSIYKFNSVFHQVDISLLRHFFAIATFGGFSKASEATGVSQPALTLGLQKLEKSLGKKLIDRSTRPFELTQAGQTLLTFCQRFQGSFESVMDSIGAAEISVQKRLRVGSALSIGIAPFLGLLKSVGAQELKYEIEVSTLNSFQLLTDVYEGRLDAALVPDDIYDSRLKFVKLRKDQIIFVVGRNHRNTFKRGSQGQLKLPLITFARDTPMRALTDKVCIAEALEFESVYAVNNIESLKALVENNVGGAFAMRSLVQSEIKSGALFEEQIPFKLPQTGICFVMRADEAGNQTAKTILKLMKGF